LNRFTALLFLTLAVAACGNHGSGAPAATVNSPTAPNPSTPSPNGVLLINGTVNDTAFRPLPGATVEVLDGPQAGTSTTADATGWFSLTGTFDDTSRFRATLRDHVAATGTLGPICAYCNPTRWIHFHLEVLAPPVNMTGDYTLTFIADRACVGLPDEVRTRTYGATITPSHPTNIPTANTNFQVALSGASFLPSQDSFPVGVAGDFVTFWFSDPALVEVIAPSTQLELYGAGGASAGTSGMSPMAVSWEGNFEYSHTDCESKNHRLILTRR
jgi:hypothetical protein